ncbi:hypothetical protein PT313_00440 [Metamycoplasma hyosynoviae]|uniref:hypothetical protein n=1 Tax=Metamycoplasma hyosynoviae TaxID=29559 RepID=UPI0023584107|nr:hypothetical protein [Metamycoplasma hyosynoviae]MDC8900197.1 hypothetical protein [Metamycoplasma hyosynoviae]MDC8915565.1 hypothetical protein [Metamycoplasma hyosynoviae]MDD1372727.1 hypothetical protein [Metamycoplasma hyosynoviae]MDD1373516.1 hypothetical protein [Metamycoplasma hyosynoviae]MDD1374070.1 hypothetical protein [Metamycoplasma hyosynoviae]
MDKKITLGQFFTIKNSWLKPQIKEFIINSNAKVLCDPFAGNGDLIQAIDFYNFEKTIGFDIDPSLNWTINDSLINIPSFPNSLILTNPPYIKKHSATRKKIDLNKYFENTSYDDVYLIALDKCLEASKNVIAIIPESFINSKYKRMNLIKSITIVEDNPFLDTEMPVCIVCFDSIKKSFKDIQIFKNDVLVNNFEDLLILKLKPKKDVKIEFNDKNGWLALRGVDGIIEKNKIKFGLKKDIKYDWEKNIKVSSRHFSLINISEQIDNQEQFIKILNGILIDLREQSKDVILTPFMGNMKNGSRRRRLDFKLARAIIEIAYQIYKNKQEG